MCEDEVEFGGKEGELVLEMLGGFEDVVEDVDDVFALVALEVVGAGAAREVADGDVVDVARCAGHGDGFGRGFVGGARTGAVDDKHSVGKGVRRRLLSTMG